MEERQDQARRPANPRRRRRSQAQIFKEDYLPVIIAGAALILILVFIIGSITRNAQRAQLERQARLEASIAAAEEEKRLAQEVEDLCATADSLAMCYDYGMAIGLLQNFSGDASKYPVLAQRIDEYQKAMDAMVLWEDPSTVVNLSFQLLIADGQKAFSDSNYGTSYNRNFVTVDEFSKILQQLYENDYILIRQSDIATGAQLNELYLPAGKKPLILTQTQVNYYTYMVDSDNDGLADAGGAGFASRLIVDGNGCITCELVNEAGQTLTGAYDLVPILEAFVETHPDFSYKGARAILAVTGYDGLFGYRTQPQSQSLYGDDQYQQTIDAATQLTQALRNAGYEIACCTYENVAYGKNTVSQIREDLNKWSSEVAPILGVVDTLVFARNSDIAGRGATYSGDKYTALQEAGFTNYLGFCTDGKPWYSAQETCIRQGRIMVTGSNMAHNAGWFEGIFDPSTVLDPARGSVPK